MINILHSKLFFTDDIIIISDSEITHISETPSQELDIARISESNITSILPKLPTNIQIIFYPFLKLFASYEPHHQGVAPVFTVEWELPEVITLH